MAKYIYKKYNTKDEYSYSIGYRRANNYSSLPKVYPSFSFNSSTGKFTLSGTPRSVKELDPGYYSYPISGVSEIERIGYIDTVYDDDTGKKYYELWKEKFTAGSPVKVQSSYAGEVIAEDGVYPNNGISGNYWYVKDRLAFPELDIKVNGVLKTSENGWVKIDEVLHEIDSIHIKIDGILKEV